MSPASVKPDEAMDAAWADSLLAAACIAVDPVALGGLRVRSAAGPVRDAWLAYWRSLLPASAPVRGIPLHVDHDRLHGGLDLAASLRTGRAIEQPGLLAQVDGGYALLSMAERIEPATAARIAAVVDTGDPGRGSRTHFGLIAFDESHDAGDDTSGDGGGDGASDSLAATLAERLGLCVDLRRCSIRVMAVADRRASITASTVADARARLPQVVADDDVTAALCETAVALGIDSLRMPRFALCAARAIAALDGRDVVDEDDVATAARLVFASRVRRLPNAGDESSRDEADPSADERAADAAPEQDASHDDTTDGNDKPEDSADDTDAARPDARESLEDRVLEATVAAIPAGLLARLARDAAAQRSGPVARSGAGAMARGGKRGAPAGIRRARPRPPERLSLIETLRAAAPWQRLRRVESPERATGSRVQVRAEDLHVVRFRERHPTTTVFVVDASGSSALHRLAEAKGAVELLLADCYVRRDQVAVLAFRGKDTQMLLPPTRSLARARRSLAGLPGGGGTPLASALDATRTLIVALRRRGDTALTVLLTDGRANVARDGGAGRPQAEADALVSARALRALGADVLLIDTSPRPYPQAAQLAREMGAVYRPLPHAGAAEMSTMIRQTAARRSDA